MAEVHVDRLVKRFEAFTAVNGIDLHVQDGEFVTLLGPSGCGKTTTLRCLAGLDEPTDGRITIGGRTVADPGRGTIVPPDKRGIGMVFQNYALWPHMTVGANVAYPLKQQKAAKRETEQRVAEVLDIVGLLDRKAQLVTALSGGQQQRVALARAISNRPQLLLFDEPLSNLDTKLRTSMRRQIRDLHRQVGTTSIYVTHDQEEAIVLADRVVVMENGDIQQIGTPRELYTRPVNAFVANFMGFENIVTGTVVDRHAGGYAFQPATGGPQVHVDGSSAVPSGEPSTVAFRSAHLRVGIEPNGRSNTFTGRVIGTAYLGSRTELEVDCGGLLLHAYVDDADMVRLGSDIPQTGDEVSVGLNRQHIVTLHPKAGSTDGHEASITRRRTSTPERSALAETRSSTP